VCFIRGVACWWQTSKKCRSDALIAVAVNSSILLDIRRVFCWISSDGPDLDFASIFRVDEGAKGEVSIKEDFACCLRTIVSCSAYCILKMEATCSYETSVYFQRATLLKVGCLHPVACTRSGSGFSSNATLLWIFYSVFKLEDGHKTETCSGYWIKYSNQCCVRRKPWTWATLRCIR
jgi:hypothetical protein